MELNQYRQGMEFQRLTAQYPGKNIQPNQMLQLEVALTTGNPVLAFGVTQNQAPASRSSEVRLNTGDAFAITAIGLFLKKEDPAKAGSGKLMAYPHPGTFTTVANELVTADLEAVYNSRLSIKVGDRVFSEGLDLNPCRTENTSATERKSYDGFIETSALITLDGGSQTALEVKIASWPGQLIQYATDVSRVYAVLRLQGFRIIGGGGLGNFVN